MSNIDVHALLNVAVSLLPVFAFLGSLVFLDSFRLVPLRSVIIAIAVGCGAAIGAFVVNAFVLSVTTISSETLSRYVAPVVEESLKGLYVIHLIRAKRVGFVVDAAIVGCAVGAGFSAVENIYYLGSIGETSMLLWAIRGFGTAVMHGGTTAILAAVAKSIGDARSGISLRAVGSALALSIAIHSFFNHVVLPPLYLTITIVIVLPLLMLLVFQQSEKSTRQWLGIGFDTETELLTMITTGNIGQTKVGMYLETLRERFPGEIVVDLLCYLRIYLELSIKAKGILMLREAGFDVEPDPMADANLKELHYLERSIGRTGKLALSPLLRMSDRDLWQLHMLTGGRKTA
jgi:RsiW-degrading membrane proteinase PrsW (M82 family)